MANAVPTASVRYDGDGSTTTFSVPFSYLDASYVFVEVDDVAVDFTWTTSDTVTLATAPAAGTDNVHVFRSTLSSSMLAVFSDDTPFLAKYVDEDNTQLLHLIQEVNSASEERDSDDTAAWEAAVAAEAATRLSVDTAIKADITTKWAHTLRTPDVVAEIPYSASGRANKTLGFDSAGNPSVVTPESGSAADVLTQLASGDGATMIGYQRDGAELRKLSDVALLVFRPEEYGAKYDGSDDLEAWNACQDAAFAAGGVVEVAAGDLYLSSTGYVKVNTTGKGSAYTRINALASGTWGIERSPNTTDDYSNSYVPILKLGAGAGDSFTPKAGTKLEGLSVVGAGSRPTTYTGARSALGFLGDGIHVADVCYTPVFVDVRVKLCQNGFNTYNYSGHISWHRCYSSDNFFGWWVDHSSGDYRMYDTNLDGNIFSSVGIHGLASDSRTLSTGTANQAGLFGWNAYGVHLGWGPYCVFQTERGASVRGLVDVNWFQCSPEAVGNRVISLSGTSVSGRSTFTNCGHSFNTTYRVTSRPYQDYVMYLGTVASGPWIVVNPFVDPNTLTGYYGYVTAIQTPVIAPSAWQYWNTTSPARLIDSSLGLFEATTPVAAGGISSSPQGIVIAAVPAAIRRASRLRVEYQQSVIASAAITNLVFKVYGSATSATSGGTLIGTVVHPVLSGSSYVQWSTTVTPVSTYEYLYVTVENGAGTLTLGVSSLAGQFTIKPVRNGI